jgi:hypothetical protein
MFYEFNQNNSGGYFDGPAEFVIVEADNSNEANDIAKSLGLYFDGVGDCQCCGNRWHKAWGDDGEEVPEIYGREIRPTKEDPKVKHGYRTTYAQGYGDKSVLIVYKPETKVNL